MFLGYAFGELLAMKFNGFRLCGSWGGGKGNCFRFYSLPLLRSSINGEKLNAGFVGGGIIRGALRVSPRGRASGSERREAQSVDGDPLRSFLLSRSRSIFTSSSSAPSWLPPTDTGLACSSPSPATLTSNGRTTSTHHLSYRVHARRLPTLQVTIIPRTPPFLYFCALYLPLCFLGFRLLQWYRHCQNPKAKVICFDSS